MWYRKAKRTFLKYILARFKVRVHVYGCDLSCAADLHAGIHQVQVQKLLQENFNVFLTRHNYIQIIRQLPIGLPMYVTE